ncbi:NAD(P)-dependent dehydrogenase (short-subunit alcohol dehydrogenase family) [Rhizobium binae]|uniref:NAD(P)-dependent dehydrogenase (Short-subunit alcohol dehydrogenase family) n=1 Tax=Rhizobium binae TaxID=1138190 RepID=A0ABV2MMK6_9HYPH
MVWLATISWQPLPALAGLLLYRIARAFDPSKYLVDYAMTKAAMMNFTKLMARQLGPKDVRVNGAAPGPISTTRQVSGGATMEKLGKYGEETPMGRPVSPRNSHHLRTAPRPAGELRHGTSLRRG